MSEQLKHIFDTSACLSKRQLRDYASGTMSREEQYAVEHHVTTCFFCSEAIDGLKQGEHALVAVEDLNANFLKDHFSLINPQVHLNSIAPSVPAQSIARSRKRSNTQPLLKPTSIAAALILGFGILWYLDFDKNKTPQRAAQQLLAQRTDEVAKAVPVAEPEVAPQQVAQMPPSAADQSSASTINPEPLANLAGGDAPQKPQALIATNPKEGSREKAPADTHTSALPEKKESAKIAAAFIAERSAPVSGDASSASPAVKVKTPAEENEAKEDVADMLVSADDLYESGKYGAALAAYKKQASPSGNRAQQYAALQAARCYVQMGQNESAIKLLQSLADNGNGSSKRQAKRMLKDLGKETGD